MAERRLFLVRHAIAEDRSATGADFDRALTNEGRKKMRRAAEGLERLGVRPAALLTSPLVRARQTAEIVSAALGGPAPEVCDALASGLDRGELTKLIDERPPDEDLMLVGHEPDFGELLAFWLTGSAKGFRTHFRKGAVACVLAGMLPPHGRATLEWLLTASQLGEMAG